MKDLLLVGAGVLLVAYLADQYEKAKEDTVLTAAGNAAVSTAQSVSAALPSWALPAAAGAALAFLAW